MHPSFSAAPPTRAWRSRRHGPVLLREDGGRVTSQRPHSLCARKVVTGPSLMGEKSTSPAKLGTNGWVVIRVVIFLDTAFIKKLGGFLAPCSWPGAGDLPGHICLPETRALVLCLSRPSGDRLIFHNDDLDALHLPPSTCSLLSFPALGT